MFFPNPNIQKFMKATESKGFFCVVYLKDEKKTVYYHKVYTPSKLATFLANRFLWIKIYIDKQDYFYNPKGTNYHAIFDTDNPVTIFNFKQFSKQ